MLFFANCLTLQAFSNSELEKFANQTGVLISKEYIELGYMDQIDIRLVKLKNLFTNETLNGLRFEYLPGNEILSSAKISFIDYDEIEALIKAIKILQTSVLDNKYEYQSEFTVKTRSGMIIGYFYDASKDKWQPFVQIQEKDPQSTIRVENDRFSYFLSVLEDAVSRSKLLKK